MCTLSKMARSIEVDARNRDAVLAGDDDARDDAGERIDLTRPEAALRSERPGAHCDKLCGCGGGLSCEVTPQLVRVGAIVLDTKGAHEHLESHTKPGRRSVLATCLSPGGDYRVTL